MRYFTIERWLRLQHGADRDAVLRGLEEWEQATHSYRSALEGHLTHAPRELRQFASSVCLHDATLLLHWQDGKEWYLLVQLEAPERSQVLLCYTLVSPAWVSPSGIPESLRTPAARWMYDEFEVEPSPESGRKQQVFQHRILFSHGWEVCLRFIRFRYSFPQLDSPLPVPALGPVSPLSTPFSPGPAP